MHTTDLIKLMRVMAEHTDLKPTTLGVYAVNDGKFFSRLEEGGDCRTKTASKAVDWFSENWPADLEWPVDIPRPLAQADAS